MEKYLSQLPGEDVEQLVRIYEKLLSVLNKEAGSGRKPGCDCGVAGCFVDRCGDAPVKGPGD